MKKNYLLILALFVALFSANAQIIEDDFEFYTLGDMGVQNPSVWSVWSGDPAAGGGITVVELAGGNQAGYIGPDSMQDALLLLGNETSGDHVLAFDMFVSTGSTAYFNIQGETETNAATGYQGGGGSGGAGGSGVFNSGNLYFNQDAANPGVFLDETTGETASYPEGEWFDVQVNFDYDFDLDVYTYIISIENVNVNLNPVPFQADNTIGAFNFFSIDANNNYWIDNVIFVGPLIIGVDDFSFAKFKAYPNPVIDELTMESSLPINSIEVFDTLGKLLLTYHPNAISPKLDMSDLSSGIYLVKATIGQSSKTVKIIK